jgi:hypothetical protein
MIDFKEQRDILIEFINGNYEEYLNRINIKNPLDLSIKKPLITDEFIDFDKNKSDFVCYIEYDNISFPQSRYNDDCSQTENIIINIFLVFRNSTPSNLNNSMLNATSAFLNMVRNEQFNDAVTSRINKVDFFKYIEGSNNIVSSKLTLEINEEI